MTYRGYGWQLAIYSKNLNNLSKASIEFQYQGLVNGTYVLTQGNQR